MNGQLKPFSPPTTHTVPLDYTVALQAAGVGIWELDLVTNTVNWDDRCRELFGLANHNQLPYEQAIRYIHPDDVARVDEAVKRATDSQSNGQYDATYRTIGADDGKLRWVRFWGQCYFTEAGGVSYFTGVAQDITQQTLDRQRQQQLAVLVEEAPEFMAVTDLEGRMQFINSYGQTLFGMSAEEVPTTHLVDFVPPEELERVITQILPGILKGRWSGLVTLMQPATKVRIPVVCDGYLLTNPVSGQPYGMAGVIRDRRPELAIQQEILERETKFRSLVEEAPVSTCLFVGEDMVIEVINEVMLGYWGRDKSVIGKPLVEALPELKGQPHLAILEEVFRSGKTYEARQVRADLMVDGALKTYYFDLIHKPLRDHTGRVYGIMDMSMDVTQQVVAQQQLVESEARYRTLAGELDELVQVRTRQLELSVQDLKRSNQNLEQFAYIASHDLQEPLRKIQSFSDLLHAEHGEQLGTGVDYIRRMQAAAGRMSTLIKDLLTYSRISTRQEATESVSLQEVVNFVLTDLEFVITETGTQIEVSPLPTVIGDESQLGQLVQNLLSNAIKFRRPDVSPVISVSAQRVRATDLLASLKPTRLAPTYWRIDVADNGIGFDDKYVDRIFQVFQRLHGKSEFAGTGIGLAICEKVAANHGGAINAVSQPGQGATFSVYLPE